MFLDTRSYSSASSSSSSSSTTTPTTPTASPPPPKFSSGKIYPGSSTAQFFPPQRLGSLHSSSSTTTPTYYHHNYNHQNSSSTHHHVQEHHYSKKPLALSKKHSQNLHHRQRSSTFNGNNKKPVTSGRAVSSSSTDVINISLRTQTPSNANKNSINSNSPKSRLPTSSTSSATLRNFDKYNNTKYTHSTRGTGTGTLKPTPTKPLIVTSSQRRYDDNNKTGVSDNLASVFEPCNAATVDPTSVVSASTVLMSASKKHPASIRRRARRKSSASSKLVLTHPFNLSSQSRNVRFCNNDDDDDDDDAECDDIYGGTFITNPYSTTSRSRGYDKQHNNNEDIPKVSFISVASSPSPSPTRSTFSIDSSDIDPSMSINKNNDSISKSIHDDICKSTTTISADNNNNNIPSKRDSDMSSYLSIPSRAGRHSVNAFFCTPASQENTFSDNSYNHFHRRSVSLSKLDRSIFKRNTLDFGRFTRSSSTTAIHIENKKYDGSHEDKVTVVTNLKKWSKRLTGENHHLRATSNVSSTILDNGVTDAGVGAAVDRNTQSPEVLNSTSAVTPTSQSPDISEIVNIVKQRKETRAQVDILKKFIQDLCRKPSPPPPSSPLPSMSSLPSSSSSEISGANVTPASSPTNSSSDDYSSPKFCKKKIQKQPQYSQSVKKSPHKALRKMNETKQSQQLKRISFRENPMQSRLSFSSTSSNDSVETSGSTSTTRTTDQLRPFSTDSLRLCMFPIPPSTCNDEATTIHTPSFPHSNPSSSLPQAKHKSYSKKIAKNILSFAPSSTSLSTSLPPSSLSSLPSTSSTPSNSSSPLSSASSCPSSSPDHGKHNRPCRLSNSIENLLLTEPMEKSFDNTDNVKNLPPRQPRFSNVSEASEDPFAADPIFIIPAKRNSGKKTAF